MRRNRFGRRWCKIVFTGAPGSGKTTALEHITKRIDAEYNDKWRVFKVAEAASFLYQGGVQRADMNALCINQWQEDIIKTIIQLESVYEHIAEFEDQRDVLIICDRGCMDPKVFTNVEQWNIILRKMGLNEAALLARYDCVLQLFTAPKEFYAKTSNPYRRESHAESSAYNDRYTDAWRNHPCLIAVSNRCDDMDNVNGDERAFSPNIEKTQRAWTRKLNEIFEHVRHIINEDENNGQNSENNKQNY